MKWDFEHKAGRIGDTKLKVPHPYGPAMSSLTPLQQRYVEALMTAPLNSNTAAMRRAGYQGKEEACRKQASRLLKNPVILEALKEASVAHLKAMIPKAVNALDNVLADPKHRDHHKAIVALLDRVGLHPVTEHKTTVEHTIDRDALISRIAVILERHGIDKLPALSREPAIKDAEFTEVRELDQ